MARIGEQLVGEDGGEMLQRHGRGEAEAIGGFARISERHCDPVLERRQVIAGVDGARLLNATCSRLWITSCVVNALISSASLGGAPSRNARTLSTKKASPLGKVADSAL